jgi:hypothetical protein
VTCNHQQSLSVALTGCQSAEALAGFPGHCQHPHPTPPLLPLLLLLLLQLLLEMVMAAALVTAAAGAAVRGVRVLCRCLLQG